MRAPSAEAGAAIAGCRGAMKSGAASQGGPYI